MAERSIIWTNTAAKQRRVVLEYWLNRNQSAEYPKRLIELIADRISVLSQYPESGKQSEIENVRMAAMGHFSIFYSFDENSIFIKPFWDNRQDPNILVNLLA